MSMVMPRAFSSGRRSQSMPVRALTSDVLPWSMWPAVPRIRSAEHDKFLPRSDDRALYRMRHRRSSIQRQGAC